MFSLSLYDDDLDLTSAFHFPESEDFRFDVDLGMDLGGDDDTEYLTMLFLDAPIEMVVLDD